MLCRLPSRRQDIDPAPIPPIPRRDQGHTILLVHGRCLYVLRHRQRLHRNLRLRSRLGILEPFTHRQVRQQNGSLA
jgi:hypothetical protein